MLTVVTPEEPTPATGSEPPASSGSLIDETVRDGARRMLAAALEAEVTAYIAAHTTEARAFAGRDLSGVDHVYLWADGVHLNVRLDEAKLCLLVLVGVRVDGRREIIALAEGHRESTESWADLLRDCKRRGMRAPILAVGDGVLGFWNALREVFPTSREQRCWFHKIANALRAMPKSAHPGAKKALAEIWNAEDREHACRAVAAFNLAYRTRITKGPGSKAAGLAMAFKLIEAARQRRRAVNAPHPIALVRAGARFERGTFAERSALAGAAA